MPEQLLRIQQAQQRLQLSRSRIYELIKSGELASLKVGPRGRRIPESAIEAFIQARMERAA